MLLLQSSFPCCHQYEHAVTAAVAASRHGADDDDAAAAAVSSCSVPAAQPGRHLPCAEHPSALLCPAIGGLVSSLVPQHSGSSSNASDTNANQQQHRKCVPQGGAQHVHIAHTQAMLCVVVVVVGRHTPTATGAAQSLLLLQSLLVPTLHHARC